jgi:hypothetical protein
MQFVSKVSAAGQNRSLHPVKMPIRIKRNPQPKKKPE